MRLTCIWLTEAFCKANELRSTSQMRPEDFQLPHEAKERDLIVLPKIFQGNGNLAETYGKL